MQRSRPANQAGSHSSTAGGSLSSMRRPESDQLQARRPIGADAEKGRASSQSMSCEACRQKKTRCIFEGSLPVCLQCLGRGTHCVVNIRKSKIEALKRAQHVRNLETRLQQMESLLRTAGLLPNDDVDGNGWAEDFQPRGDDLDEDDEDYEPAPDDSSDQSPASDKTAVSSVNSAQPMSSRDTAYTSKGRAKGVTFMPEGNYYGRASSLCILSQDGIDFIRERSGETEFPKAILSQPCWELQPGEWRPDVFHDLFSCKVFKPLPPRSEVFSLLKIYFETVNRIFPIFHEETFMRTVEWQYTQQTLTDVGRWAAINVLLAFSYRYRPSHGSKPEKDIDKAWMYLKNAASVYTQLALQRNNVLGVQALAGMALFVRANANLHLALPLVTAAIRSCHALGLHQRHPRPDLSEVEQETRRRVFWCALWLDQSISIHMGTGCVQNSEDLDLDLPTADSKNGSNMDWSAPFFRILCQHTLIRCKIYRELYSSRALGKPLSGVQRTVDELSEELDGWRRENPYLRSKPSAKAFLDNDQEIEHVSICSQWFAYFNSLILINRMPLIHELVHCKGLYTPLKDMAFLSSRAQKSSWICIQAARDTLKILQNLPSRDVGYTWSFLEYIFVATLIVFGNILRESSSVYTEEHMGLLNSAVTYFNTLVPQDGRHKSARFMATMSSILEATAKKIVSDASKDSNLAYHTKPSEFPDSTIRTSNFQIPDIEGLPSVPSSGYFVPGSPMGQTRSNTFNSEQMDLDTTHLMPAPLQAGEQLNTTSPRLWTLPTTDYSVLSDPSMSSYLWDIPFLPEWQMFNQMPEMLNPPVPQMGQNGQNGQNASDTAFPNVENVEWLHDLRDGASEGYEGADSIGSASE